MKKIMIAVTAVFAIVIGMWIGPEKAYAQENKYSHEEIDRAVDEFVDALDDSLDIIYPDLDVEIYHSYWYYGLKAGTDTQYATITIVYGNPDTHPITQEFGRVSIDELVSMTDSLNVYNRIAFRF